MPEINNIFIDDPKRLREPIKALEVVIAKLFYLIDELLIVTDSYD